ncbi:MAG TPA: hypothetical protein VHL11_05535 [Phototrophicaceae bacterium]|nr:hypothetical protein [Phototrophicaceae bacterium]
MMRLFYPDLYRRDVYRHWLTMLLFSLFLGLAACQTTPPTPTEPPPVPTPIGEVTHPELIDEIQWDRSPSTVVFRADVTGGTIDDEFYSRNDIPYCTIYGDNRVVWTTTTIRTDDGVVFDIVSDEQIRLFVDRLTNFYNIYNYKTGADLLVPSDVEPVVERLTLFVNGNLHQTDSLGGWEYTYFRQILEDCQNISTTPVTFAPDGAWVSAKKVDYDPSHPSITWDGEAADLKLSDLAASGERKWITGRNITVLWDRLRNNGPDIQFEEGDSTFLAALEVPNITRSSPPAP